MSTRFHVPTRVFGSRRRRGERPGIEPEGPAPMPGLVTGTDPVLIDPMLDDRPGISCAYLIPGRRNLLIDPCSALAAPRVLEALKDRPGGVDLILLTHIHPEIAAGVGVIARHFSAARIIAPAGTDELLADPQAMISGMEKLYGDRLEKMYGRPAAIDAARIEEVRDGETIDLGDRTIEAISTPGHTSAHMAYFDSATGSLFCGDALGVQLPGSRVVRPSTPPFDFSLEDALASIERLAAVGSEAVYLAHFGAARPGPEEVFPLAADALQRWHRAFLKQRARTSSDEDLSRQFNACLEASLEPVAPSARRGLETVSPAWLNLAGLHAEQERLAARLRDAA